MMPGNWPQQWEAAKHAHAFSQARGGFLALNGPGFKPTASALLQNQPWNEPGYQRPKDPRKKKAAVMPSPLKNLPKGYIPPEQRPKIGQAIAKLQGPTVGGAGQQDLEEPMDESTSHISASEAGRSETPSERVEREAVEHMVFSETQSDRQERQAGEGILMSSPDTIQGTEGEDGDDDESDSKEDSNEDSEEESEES